jgi:SAM-dependent methyltransferase
MKKTYFIFFVLLLLIVPQRLTPQELVPQELHLDVPYVPTPPEVVAKMLEMAHAGKGDLLYDLGCGDGRIVITAALHYGIRGVGFDMNPERIKECNENAAAAKVTNLVKFIEQDLFQADFHEASVVTLYLLTSVNLRLRPILLSVLRPGTRVVSHDFAMDTWEPDDSAQVRLGGLSHDVYLWVIPANVSGTWHWTRTEGVRKTACTLDLEQRFQHLGGKFKYGEELLPLKDLRLSGDHLWFSLERDEDGKPVTLVFDGVAVRNTLTGTLETRGGAKPGKQPWSARRDIETMKPIDAEVIRD